MTIPKAMSIVTAAGIVAVVGAFIIDPPHPFEFPKLIVEIQRLCESVASWLMRRTW